MTHIPLILFRAQMYESELFKKEQSCVRLYVQCLTQVILNLGHWRIYAGYKIDLDENERGRPPEAALLFRGIDFEGFIYLGFGSPDCRRAAP